MVDRIDEESHRHAYGVSQDLKFSLREAIELRSTSARSSWGIRRLRYMYRLLFLLYIRWSPILLRPEGLYGTRPRRILAGCASEIL